MVYLYCDETLRGFVAVNAHGYSIASASQAADRPVFVQYWGHEPAWMAGAGLFAGAHLAFESRDLPATHDQQPNAS